MRIHILGISGTFMGGLALLAKASGHHVSGCDQNIYPPMSDQLEQAGITLYETDDLKQLDSRPDAIIVGNVMRRGYPIVEKVLASRLPYYSGPSFLAKNILKDRWVLAVTGTHGKTTTSSLLAWILEDCGLSPGFLIGGIPNNFGVSARLGESQFFVIEGDEYDSAFFDKRSKFIHYHPQTAIINNIEYDHADIFPDVAAIKQQFHYFVRTIANDALIIAAKEDTHVKDVLAMGCWTPTTTFALNSGDWQASDIAADGSCFTVIYRGEVQGEVQWSLLGLHNVENALAAIAAAHHVDVPIDKAIASLSTFTGVKRRLEVRGKINGITVYDDFAHHPTAIKTTLAGLRHKIGNDRIIAIVELGSYTMREGVHGEHLLESFVAADMVYLAVNNMSDVEQTKKKNIPIFLHANAKSILEAVVPIAKAGDHIVIMSNKGFDNIHQILLNHLTGN